MTNDEQRQCSITWAAIKVTRDALRRVNSALTLAKVNDPLGQVIAPMVSSLTEAVARAAQVEAELRRRGWTDPTEMPTDNA